MATTTAISGAASTRRRRRRRTPRFPAARSYGATSSNGAAGASPDATKWTFDVSGSGWGNGELEYYTARPENVALDGAGHLAITARAESYLGKDYTSGRINTRAASSRTPYGRFEARMQMPAGQGIWPAFWMLGDNQPTVGWPACGEIDIMENLGQRAEHGARHGARPRLLGRQRHQA